MRDCGITWSGPRSPSLRTHGLGWRAGTWCLDRPSKQRHPHMGPVPDAAWAAAAEARARGRVAVFNGSRADSLDGGRTMHGRIWDLMRTRVLDTIDEPSGPTARSR